MFGFIYLLQTRESVKCNESIYKIGKTTQDNLKRFQSYPNGSILFFHIYCFDVNVVEKKLIEVFNSKFVNVPLYGYEYFEGDLDTMINTICSLRNFTCNKDTSISKYYKEFSDLTHKYKKLEDDYFNVVEKNKQLLSKIDELKLELQEDVSDTIDNVTNEGGEKENTFVVENKEFKCLKCNRILSSKQKLISHQEKCDGFLNKKQCQICLKLFATRQGKSQHMKNVNCSPPL